ncbi:MAG: hypothetical protein J0J05_06150 [Microbacterium sp.]|uniref:hypothetical protein n=2 Tax=Bacteria TaxID=2 RepID=UPI001AC5EEFC|nr:hypothetical protein [Microbacterium sp.]MBN9153546.1 hypothetical protein [Microbacterium sp.]
MGTEYWYVHLPSGAKLRGETPMDAINRELNELVGRGWEPVSITSPYPNQSIYVMLKKVPS